MTISYITDLSIFLRDILTTAAIIAVIVGLLKPLLEVKVKPTMPLHDTLVQIMAILIGVVFLVIITAVTVMPDHYSPAMFALAILNGGIAGFAAIGLYHLVTLKNGVTANNTNNAISDLSAKIEALAQQQRTVSIPATPIQQPISTPITSSPATTIRPMGASDGLTISRGSVSSPTVTSSLDATRDRQEMGVREAIKS